MSDVRPDKVSLPTAGAISQFVTLFTKLYPTEYLLITLNTTNSDLIMLRQYACTCFHQLCVYLQAV